MSGTDSTVITAMIVLVIVTVATRSSRSCIVVAVVFRDVM